MTIFPSFPVPNVVRFIKACLSSDVCILARVEKGVKADGRPSYLSGSAVIAEISKIAFVSDITRPRTMIASRNVVNADRPSILLR